MPPIPLALQPRRHRADHDDKDGSKRQDIEKKQLIACPPVLLSPALLSEAGPRQHPNDDVPIKATLSIRPARPADQKLEIEIPERLPSKTVSADGGMSMSTAPIAMIGPVARTDCIHATASPAASTNRASPWSRSSIPISLEDRSCDDCDDGEAAGT
jgi:hypothetical protein